MQTCVFLAEDLQLTDVIARGKFVMQDGTIVKEGKVRIMKKLIIFLYWIPLYLFICNSRNRLWKGQEVNISSLIVNTLPFADRPVDVHYYIPSPGVLNKCLLYLSLKEEPRLSLSLDGLEK